MVDFRQHGSEAEMTMRTFSNKVTRFEGTQDGNKVIVEVLPDFTAVPPAGTYKLTDDEDLELYEILSATVEKYTAFRNKFIKRIIKELRESDD